MEDNHEIKFLPIGAGGSRFGRLCGGTNHSDYDNDDPAGDHYRPRAGGRGDPTAAASARWDSDSRTGTGVRLGNRLLAMDGNDLCVGAWKLGRAPDAKRSLGARSLGASLQRVGMGPRPLAI